MIASRLHATVVPVRIVGLDRVLHRSAKWPRMGRVDVKFGAPILLSGDDFAALAARVEAGVRHL
jgi:long-chain acyl-CoA synthetase